jgi:hypothetical protein
VSVSLSKGGPRERAQPQRTASFPPCPFCKRGRLPSQSPLLPRMSRFVCVVVTRRIDPDSHTACTVFVSSGPDHCAGLFCGFLLCSVGITHNTQHHTWTPEAINRFPPPPALPNCFPPAPLCGPRRGHTKGGGEARKAGGFRKSRLGFLCFVKTPTMDLCVRVCFGSVSRIRPS